MVIYSYRQALQRPSTEREDTTMTKYTMTTRPSSYHMATATKAMMLEKHIAMLHEIGRAHV